MSPRSPLTTLTGLSFSQTPFPTDFHCGREGILLATRHFLAALDQFVRAFPEFAGLFLREILTLIRLFREKFPGLFAGFRRKQNAHERPNPQPYQEISHFRTNVVRHSNLHGNRSTAVGCAQCSLTAMPVRMRLRCF